MVGSLRRGWTCWNELLSSTFNIRPFAVWCGRHDDRRGRSGLLGGCCGDSNHHQTASDHLTPFTDGRRVPCQRIVHGLTVRWWGYPLLPSSVLCRTTMAGLPGDTPKGPPEVTSVTNPPRTDDHRTRLRRHGGSALYVWWCEECMRTSEQGGRAWDVINVRRLRVWSPSWFAPSSAPFR